MRNHQPRLALCMKWGTRYGPEYVNRLWRGLQRHVAGPVQLVCFTDDGHGIEAGVDVRPLPQFEGVRADLAVKPWRKLSLWQANLGADLVGRDALFLDLDVVLTGPLDDFWAYEPGTYCVIANWTKAHRRTPGGQAIGNTSVFRFKVGAHPEIYQRFMADPVGLYEREFRIEQEYISDVLGQQGVQRFWPASWCRSFKEELLPAWPLRLWQVPKLPEDCKIVVFHGKPDPDEARDGRWPARGWKKLYKVVRPTGWIGQHWR